MPDTTAAASPKAKAGFNEIFICAACARAFADRAAKEPVEVTGESALVKKTIPHPKYPGDPELAKVEWVMTPMAGVKIPARDAAACCPSSNVLCDSRYLRIRQDGKAFEIVGAKHLE